jgi:uncharacterized protein YukE
MLAPESNGYGAITGNSYEIKTMGVAAGSASGYTAAEIEQLFSYLDPGAVAQAGSAHKQASTILQQIAEALVTHASTLHSNWGGTAADSAMTSFQQLHTSATKLSTAAGETGAVLEWLGNEILPTYKNYKAPSNGIVGDVESLFGDNPQNKAAQAKMEELNDRLVQANGGLPSSVSVDLPQVSSTKSGSTSTSGAGGTAAGAGAGGVTGLTGAAGGGRVGVSQTGGTGTGGDAPGTGVAQLGVGKAGGAVSTTHLASTPTGAGPTPGSGSAPGGGVSPGSGSGGGGGAPGSTGTGGSDPIGTFPMPGGPPGGPGGPPGTGPGEPGDNPGLRGADGDSVGSDGLVGEGVVGMPGDSAVVGTDGMIGNASGGLGADGMEGGMVGGDLEAGGELGVGNSGATGFVGADGAVTDGAVGDGATTDAAGSGGAGFPMGGSGSGRQQKERRRQAWMAEEADVWESDDQIAPSQISG